MAPSFKTAAALLGLAAVASAGWDATRKDNVVIYWGQGQNQLDLLETCKNSNVDVINIAFINQFPDSAPGGYPGSDFGNKCWAGTYNNTQGVSTALYNQCPTIGPNIKDCQTIYGKTIMLSLGGAAPGNYYIKDDNSAKNFADFLWKSFGPVQAGWTIRPFGDAVVDGFDLDIESWIDPSKLPTDSTGAAITDYRSRGYAAFVNEMRLNYAPRTEKSYYISGAPQCQYTDLWLNDAITSSHFDWLFIQFYNTPGCSARDGVNKINHPGQTADINLNVWDTGASSNSDMKLVLGLPAAPGAAADTFYISQVEAAQLFYNVRASNYNRFAGAGLWEATYSQKNTLCGRDYSSWIKQLVSGYPTLPILVPSDEAHCPAVVSSSVVSSSSKAASSSSVIVSTSSVVSSSSQGASTSSGIVSTSSVISSSSSIMSSSSAIVSSSSSKISSSSVAISSSSSSSAAGISSSSAVISSSAAISTSSAMVSSAASSSSSVVSTTSPATTVSVSCLSKPSDAHTKSRTRPHSPIRYCTSGCTSSSTAVETNSSSAPVVQGTLSNAVKSSVVSSACSKTRKASSKASSKTELPSASSACLSKPTCSSGCKTRVPPSSSPNATPTSTAPVASSTLPPYESMSVPVYADSTSLPSYGGSSTISAYPGTSILAETSSTCLTKPTSCATGCKTRVPASSSSTATPASSVSAVTSSLPPVYPDSISAVPSSSTTCTKDEHKSTAVVTSTLPPYGGESTIPAKSSTVTIPPYHAESSATVSSSIAVVTSTVTAPHYGDQSTVMIFTSTIVATVSAPGYEHVSSVAAVSSASTAPVYGVSTTPAAVPSSSATSMGEYSAPAGYKDTTSLAPAKSIVSGPVALSTVYVIPVGSATKAAQYTAVPSSTTPKPAQYTGAASKPVVGMSMMAVVFGAIFFL